MTIAAQVNNQKKQSSALITGATGFIGSHLTRRLVAHGWDVNIIVRPNSDLTILKGISQQLTVHTHDGSIEKMISIVEKAKPVIVFHLASLFLVQHQPKDIDRLINSNVHFATQLVEAMIVNGVNRLINTGTSWQHFQNKDYDPVCLYAATKQAFEAILQFYTETTSLKTITLKLFDTYGLNDPRPKLFTLLKKLALEQKPLAMSPGEQLLDIVYIDDVVEAYMVAAERLLKNKVSQQEFYAITSGSPIKLKYIVENYCKIIDRQLPIKWGVRPYRHREVMVPWNKGKVLPGWEPKIKLDDGIRKIEGI